LLDDIERGVDQTNGDMRGAQSRMIRLLKRTSDCKWILAIIVLAMIALGLLGWVFRAH
jgi:1,4-dihydroxy-2-naphthoate octaprenyltransferase